MPPTEKRGRVQTSTVTVAVLPIPEQNEFKLKESELEEFVARGSGPGGQHRNKTDSCVTIHHKPTGIRCRADMRSQHESRRIARATLEARVADHYASKDVAGRNQSRRDQVGSGMRGDKVRTYRVQDNQVTDHRTEAKARLSAIKEGKLDLVW